MNKNYNSIKMKKYFIAYFDILGFRDIDYTSKNNRLFEMTNALQTVIDYSNKMIEELKKENSKNTIKYRILTDNFIYISEYGLVDLILLIGHIQAFLVKHNFFIRGSIVYGDLSIRRDIIFGAGMNEAYRIEHDISIVPRIIIDKSVYNGPEWLYAGIFEILSSQINSTKLKVHSDLIKYLFHKEKLSILDFDNNQFIHYCQANSKMTH